MYVKTTKVAWTLDWEKTYFLWLLIAIAQKCIVNHKRN